MHSAGEPLDVTVHVLDFIVVRALHFPSEVVVGVVRESLVLEIEPDDKGDAEEERDEEAADLRDVFAPRNVPFGLLLDF